MNQLYKRSAVSDYFSVTVTYVSVWNRVCTCPAALYEQQAHAVVGMLRRVVSLVARARVPASNGRSRYCLQPRAVPLLVAHSRSCSSSSARPSLTPSQRAALEEQVIATLRTVEEIDPAIATVSEVIVQPLGRVSVAIDFSTAACPHRHAIEQATREAVLRAEWATDCAVEVRVRRPRSFMGTKAPPALQAVGSLIGISSCKGGVGKSTVAANLAFALAELGGRVGLLDADVHGPSLPSLVRLPAEALPVTQRAKDKLLAPPLVGGVRLMSYGFIAKGASTGRVPAAVMRGPMVGKVVQQMLSGTAWGELDYLLVDLPPGTGDVHLTLCQTYGLTAALVVTTPQKLARVDVEKGIDMFRELGVPIAALVENMAYFTDPRGEVHHPFGRTQLEAVREYARVGSMDALRLPIEPEVSEACDEGLPVVLSRPQSETAKAVREAAARLTLTLARLQQPAAHSHTTQPPSLRFDPRRGLIVRMLHGADEGREFVMPRDALAALPGAPPVAVGHNAARTLPAGLSMGAAPDGEPSVIVRWEGGGESVLPLAELKARSSSLGAEDAEWYEEQ